MALLDQHGNPFQIADIAEPQTARIAILEHKTIESQLDGLTPAKAARLLRDADAGNIAAQHQLFDDMLDRDPHLRCEYEKRASAPNTLDWSIVPPTDASRAEKKLAAWVEEIVRDVVDDFEDVIVAMMDAPGHGFGAVELEWQRWGTEWIPEFHPRPQTWFQMDVERRHIRLQDGTPDGAKLVPMGWIFHSARKVKTGYAGRAGLLRPAVWPFLYKAYAIGDFAEFLETYGLPIIMGKYPAGSGPEEKASLLRAVAALGHDARAIMPEGMQMEINTVSGGAGGSHHLAMVDWADRAHSKLILGQVLSAEAKATGMGSGVADLQGEVRSDILTSDARQLASTLTRDLVYPLIALNRGGVDGLRRCPRFVFDLGEAEDLKLFAEALPALSKGGARIPVSWVHEKLRIPMAGTDEAVFGEVPAAPPAPPVPPAALSAARQPPSPARYAGRAADQLTRDAAEPVGEWMAALRAIVMQAESVEDLRSALLDAYGNLPSDRLALVMESALATAELAGRFDVSGGK